MSSKVIICQNQPSFWLVKNPFYYEGLYLHVLVSTEESSLGNIKILNSFRCFYGFENGTYNAIELLKLNFCVFLRIYYCNCRRLTRDFLGREILLELGQFDKHSAITREKKAPHGKISSFFA